MANFSEHISQVKHNLELLSHTNRTYNSAWDWQVTMCFYAAVHLVNAHIAAKQNLHYRTHNQVKHALNPCKSIPIGTEFSEDLYKAYVKLQNLSRRSRYLCQDVDTPSDSDVAAYFTYDKHLKKALLQLDKLLNYIQAEYKDIQFPVYSIDCIEIERSALKFFRYTKVPQVA